jgi:integrase
VEGTVEGKYIRRSLKTRSWERGEELRRQIEDGRSTEEQITIATAIEKFLADCQARNLTPDVLRKYKLLGTRLQDYASLQGIQNLRDFGREQIVDFRGTWQGSPRTLQKHLERTKSFFRFSSENGWVQGNPAAGIKAPQVRATPTLPFTEGQQSSILANATSPKIKAFIEILLYTGLRIGDACLLTTERIQDGEVFLYTAKTGSPVKIPLPPSTLKLLELVRPKGGHYFIFRESVRMESVADRWRDILKVVFKNACVPKAHPHQFRDTFAVELLKKGVPLETVSILLGHASIKVTEKHYSPWVKERQDLLSEAVKKLWLKPKLVRVK